MFIGLDIEHQQFTTPRTTRLSQTPSGRPAARPQSPRAISQVREKRYDRMGFGFMHTVLKYQNVERSRDPTCIIKTWVAARQSFSSKIPTVPLQYIA